MLQIMPLEPLCRLALRCGHEWVELEKACFAPNKLGCMSRVQSPAGVEICIVLPFVCVSA